MKAMIFILLMCSCTPAMSQKAMELAASCHNGKEGRCSGSAYCSACKNCSRCAHCSSGGSCGVCSSSGDAYYTAPTPKKKKIQKVASRSNIVNLNITKGEIRNVTIDGVNLRKGPGVNYKIVQKLDSEESVEVIKSSGEWIFVKVTDTGNQGFIHFKYLQ